MTDRQLGGWDAGKRKKGTLFLCCFVEETTWYTQKQGVEKREKREEREERREKPVAGDQKPDVKTET